MIKSIKIKEFFLKNMSYKILALAVAFPLWMNFVGKANAILIKEIKILYITQRELVVSNESIRRVSVTFFGPREALKQFYKDAQSITLDISDKESGVKTIPISGESIDLPVGVKILEITPTVIKVRLVKSAAKDT